MLCGGTGQVPLQDAIEKHALNPKPKRVSMFKFVSNNRPGLRQVGWRFNPRQVAKAQVSMIMPIRAVFSSLDPITSA